MRILYIEDNPDDVVRVREMLAQNSDYNYELESLTSVSAGLKRLEKGNIDLILLDMGLSGLQGHEAIQTLRKQFPALPIVILTGTLREKERGIQALKLGIQDYLVKEEINGPVLARAIRYAKEKKDLDQLKESFIGTVSHELRTPLAVISMGLENLHDGILGQLNEKQVLAVQRNIQNAKRLGLLVENLLDLARLEAGLTRIEKKDVELEHFIHEVMQNFQAGEKEGEVSFEEEIATKLPPLECDPDLIAQVLTNLLSNAVRYAKKKIVVKTALIPSFIQISVSNDGPGIAPEGLNKLFDKFVQLDRENHKGTYKGTGLGLAICKEIIKKHQGKIWAENLGGGGVVFHFTLPICGGVEDES